MNNYFINHTVLSRKFRIFQISFSYTIIFTFLSQLFIASFLTQHGDIETNPGPKEKSKSKISFCHWNLNSLPAHNFLKLSSFEAYNSIHKHDIICFSETFLDSTVSVDDPVLSLNNYKLVRSDHPSNSKREVFVCILKSHYLFVFWMFNI